jgi:hypothetical protein
MKKEGEMFLRRTAMLLATVLLMSSMSVGVGRLVLTDSALAKPPGGGSGGSADPRLVYINKFGHIEVANLDGSAMAAVLPPPDQFAHNRPNWSPLGSGTAGNPYRIVYESPALCNPSLNVLDLVIVGGRPTAAGPPMLLPTGAREHAPLSIRATAPN